MQLYDWDVMGKEKIGTGQSQPIEELPAGEPQELWIPIELETAHVSLFPWVTVFITLWKLPLLAHGSGHPMLIRWSVIFSSQTPPASCKWC